MRLLRGLRERNNYARVSSNLKGEFDAVHPLVFPLGEPCPFHSDEHSISVTIGIAHYYVQNLFTYLCRQALQNVF
jgi:hypothetical protein